MMKNILLISPVFLLLISINPVQAGSWKDRLKEVIADKDVQQQAESILSNDDVVAGLKEALTKGAQFAVGNLGQNGGFLDNPDVHIPMPKKLQSVEKLLRKLGKEKYADQLVSTMNQAAESAVPLTLDIIKSAVTKMSFEDAKNILSGPDNAATEYLRKVGGEEMSARIAPIVAEATEKAKVSRDYKKLFKKLGFMGSMFDPDDYDIDKYVTQKTVDGLFHMIAIEEAKIRKDPVARTTDILKKVFGG